MTRYSPILDLSKKAQAKGLFITDLHYPENHRGFIQKYFKQKYDFILLGGDITEGTTMKSPGASLNGPSEKEGIKQFEADLKLISPGTHIEMVLGNHDVRSKLATGQDVTLIEKICEYNNINLSSNHTVFSIRVGNSVFKILLSHGYGGGATASSVLNVLNKLRENIDATCDLYLCGHFHKYVWTSDDFRGSRTLSARPNVMLPYFRSQILAAAGSPSKWEDSYAEGSARGGSFKSCAVKGLEIHLLGQPTNNHTVNKSIQHVALYD